MVESIQKLGNPELSSRQTAIEKVIANPNISYGYYPLVASLKDKIIITNVLKALGKIDDFRAVPILIEVFMNNYGEKGASVRGLSAQAIGSIVKTLNEKEKLFGTKKMFQMVKKDDFEKKIESLLPNINKDVKNSSMRGYYYPKPCLQWILLLCSKLVDLKKKEVKAAFVKINLPTPLSKSLKETADTIQAVIGG
ncbi:MAG TPA: hypothetical protein ENH82_00960 [bacterium]|nr:hypothetical protein [bacterium]